MMKASGGFSTMWMADLINNIVKDDSIPDDLIQSILVPVYKGKGDRLICGPCRAIKLLDPPMKGIERVFEKRIRCQVSIDSIQFGLMPGKGTICIMRQVQEKHQAKKKKLYYVWVYLENAFDIVHIEGLRWALRKLGVDKWLIRTVMALCTDTCTVVRTYAGLSESFEMKVSQIAFMRCANVGSTLYTTMAHGWHTTKAKRCKQCLPSIAPML